VDVSSSAQVVTRSVGRVIAYPRGL